MADRPILFSAPMVRALLEGRKTMTRRVISRARVFATPERPAFTLSGDDLARAMQNADRFRHIDGDGWFWEADAFEWQHPHTRTRWMAHIGYAPGDRLWVREAHYVWSAGRYDGTCQRIDYRADTPDAPCKWASSIHMPRWASRLTLIVESVKVERLQNISGDDCAAEGIPINTGAAMGVYLEKRRDNAEAERRWSSGMRQQFRDLWNSINGAGSWDANPWVAAYSFQPVFRNIDEVQQ